MALLGAFMAPERHSDMWVELVKSSIQIIVLAVAGGVVGAVLRDRDAARDAEIRRRAYFLAFLDQIDVSYGQVKSVRRMLRTYGFGQPREGGLTPQQVVGFRTQMAHLNDAEVAYEMHARKVAALAGRFGEAAERSGAGARPHPRVPGVRAARMAGRAGGHLDRSRTRRPPAAGRISPGSWTTRRPRPAPSGRASPTRW